MASAPVLPGVFRPDQYTGTVSKAYRQLTDGRWEDMYHPGHVLTEAEAQALASQDSGPYAQGQGGFLGSLAHFIQPIASVVGSLGVPGVSNIANGVNAGLNLLGTNIGGGGAGGAGGSGGSAGASTSAANQFLAGTQGSVNSLNQVGQDFMARYNAASPVERQGLAMLAARAGMNIPGVTTQGSPSVSLTGGQGGGSQPGGGGGSASPTTPVPMLQRGNLNGGQPFPGWGSRGTLPGTTVVHPAGTPVQWTGAGQATYGTPGGNGGGAAGGDPATDAALGLYNSPEYRLLRQAAEESAGQNAINMGQAYTHNLLARGLQNSSLMTGGQAGIIANQSRNAGDFLRQLGLNAADKQDQLTMQAMNAAQPALGALGNAGNAYQAAGQLSHLGAQTMLGQSNMERQASGLPNGSGFPNLTGAFGGTTGINGPIGGITDYNASNDQPAPGTSPSPAGPPQPNPALGEMVDAGMAAHGGFVPAGFPTLTGERGPENFVPAKGQKEGTINLPHSIFMLWLQHILQHGGAPAARAVGGSISQGRPTMVGEHGPEIIVTRQPGYILPHSPADMTDQSAQQLAQVDPMFLALHRMYSGRS